MTLRHSITNMMMNDYSHQFHNAVNRTRAIGLETPCIVFKHSRYLNKRVIKRLLAAVAKMSCGVPSETFLDQCLDFHYQVLPLVHKKLGTQPYFTICEEVNMYDNRYTKTRML